MSPAVLFSQRFRIDDGSERILEVKRTALGGYLVERAQDQGSIFGPALLDTLCFRSEKEARDCAAWWARYYEAMAS